MTTTTRITQHSTVAGQAIVGEAGTFRASNPATGAPVGPEFTLLSEDQVELATVRAAAADEEYRALDHQRRGAFLRGVAERIEAIGHAVVTTAMSETGLPEARLRGELARTLGQLRMFADIATRGDHLGVRIEPALPERTPLPRPDLRQVHVPLGPVAVFGASNFPLAFSVAGGDTASALAAGCPVVFKAHEAHPGTSHLVAGAVTAAVSDAGLPGGVFSLLFGAGPTVGQRLAADPRITAIGFTGSRRAGQALIAAAAARPVPIPVYAEMSAVNPVFLLPGSLRANRRGVAERFVSSLTGSAGQLCTAPGVLFVPAGSDGDDFLAEVSELIESAVGQTMLTAEICSARRQGDDRLTRHTGVSLLARGTDGHQQNSPAPAVYRTSLSTFLSSPELAEEVFGAVGLVVTYDDPADLTTVARRIAGQLTATLHLDPEDRSDASTGRALIARLVQRAGRVLVNGWPTGVDVGDAMVHGGPFPATSDSRYTSVGAAAIERFQRPVVYQDVPAELLPEPVRDENPWKLARRVDGRFEAPPGYGNQASAVW